MVIFFFFFTQSACSDLRRPSSIIRRPSSLAKDPIIAPYSCSKCTVPDSISSYQSGRCQLLLIIAPAYSAASALPNPTRSLILQRRSPGFPLLFRPQRLRQPAGVRHAHTPRASITHEAALPHPHPRLCSRPRLLTLSPSHAHARRSLKEHITTTPRHLHPQGESPTGTNPPKTVTRSRPFFTNQARCRCSSCVGGSVPCASLPVLACPCQSLLSPCLGRSELGRPTQNPLSESTAVAKVVASIANSDWLVSAGKPSPLSAPRSLNHDDKVESQVPQLLASHLVQKVSRAPTSPISPRGPSFAAYLRIYHQSRVKRAPTNSHRLQSNLRRFFSSPPYHFSLFSC